jgi:formylglycine-generating enzyme required for sulfatase activity
MTDHNNLTDKEIRDLLKRRLLEQETDDDLLTQKLIDMEAKLAFSNEALKLPSLQKEKQFLNSLTKRKFPLLKWILPSTILLTILLFFVLKDNNDHKSFTPVNEQSIPAPVHKLPEQKTDVVVLSDSAYSETREAQLNKVDTISIKKDTVSNQNAETWNVGQGIKIDYKPGKHNPKFVDSYENIPNLSEKEIRLTGIFKAQMVKQLIKKDKRSWAYVPMSTDVFYGDTVSMYAFYIAASEVTNNQYRTFLNDLIIQGKIDEYVKAVPDTSRWISDGRALWYKLQPDSTKWPGSPVNHFEPLRKNYFWHPAYDSYPVVCVSREGAKLYCDWLTNAVNEKIKNDNEESKWNSLFINDLRIPQDVEWMLAARAGHGQINYPWSIKSSYAQTPQNAKGCYLANFCIRNYKTEKLCPNCKFPDAFNSAATVSHDYIFMAPVMSYNPNDNGLYCMSGNAAEMVIVSKTGKPGTKGGSWASDAEHIKIDAEDEYGGITDGSMYIGFRPVFKADVRKKR